MRLDSIFCSHFCNGSGVQVIRVIINSPAGDRAQREVVRLSAQSAGGKVRDLMCALPDCTARLVRHRVIVRTYPISG